MLVKTQLTATPSDVAGVGKVKDVVVPVPLATVEASCRLVQR